MGCIRPFVVWLSFLLLWVSTGCFAQQSPTNDAHGTQIVASQANSPATMPEGIKTATATTATRTSFLAIITNPNIAYILLLVGICGILFELLNPGFILPGVVGVVSLLLALYAFQLLPINYAGLALLVAGILFLIVEAFFTSGVLAVTGMAAFVVGSLFLLQKGVPGFHIAIEVILGVSIVVALFFLIVIHMAVRARLRPVVSGAEQLLNSVGEVASMDGNQTLVRVNGELWQVRSEQALYIGQKVIVKGREGLVLSVQPIQNDS